VYTGCFGC
jgi:hypothetical protein